MGTNINLTIVIITIAYGILVSKTCRSEKINYNEVQETNIQSDDHNSEVSTLFHVNDVMVNNVKQPYKVTMTIEKVSIIMKVDTGCELSVISYGAHCKYFDKMTVQNRKLTLPCAVTLTRYT